MPDTEPFALTVPKLAIPDLIGGGTKDVTINVPCARRALLYQDKLTQTYSFLLNLWRNRATQIRRRFTYALSGERLLSLLDDLADVLDDYVAFGVSADTKPLLENLGRDQTREQVYGIYGGQIASPNGVTQFYQRYPLLRHAVNRLTDYFQSNIRLCCSRVQQDWDEIELGFLEDNDTLLRLLEIQTTGSDFHKGGKQVLILTFEWTPPAAQNNPRRQEAQRYWRASKAHAEAIGGYRARPGIGGRQRNVGVGGGGGRRIARRDLNTLDRGGFPLKVVYKPSDIEIDCRIMGNTLRLNRARQRAPRENPRQTLQNPSLMELINGWFAHQRGDLLALPTYTILPYHPGSSIANDPPGEALRESYGYIEFLTHEPYVKNFNKGDIRKKGENNQLSGQLRAVCYRNQNWARTMDWVTDDAAKVRACYRTWGRLCAITLALSISDMHVQNVIVHKHKPHLIDLEDSVKWPMRRIDQTGILQLTAASCDNLRFPEVVFNVKSWEDGVLKCGKGGGTSYSPTVIYTYDQTTGPRRETRAMHRDHIYQGFDDIVNRLKNNPTRAALKIWAAHNFSRVITRFVPIATGDYYDYLANWIGKCCTVAAPPDPRLPDSFLHARFDHQRYFEGRIRIYRQVWRGNLGNARNDPWTGVLLPIFALDYPRYNWLDVVNYDIPSFYKRLDQEDLLSSVGEAVNVHRAWQWQDRALAAVNIDSAIDQAIDRIRTVRQPPPQNDEADEEEGEEEEGEENEEGGENEEVEQDEETRTEQTVPQTQAPEEDDDEEEEGEEDEEDDDDEEEEEEDRIVHFFPQKPIDMLMVQIDRLVDDNVANAVNQSIRSYCRRPQEGGGLVFTRPPRGAKLLLRKLISRLKF